MSSKWNGMPMASIRTSSILDAVDSALKRCGAWSSSAGISAERVRFLMAEQNKLFAHVKMPSQKIPERALKKGLRTRRQGLPK
jgi:hypothetical protein